MDIETRLQFVARHESLHALFAYHAGLKVDHLSIHPKGETVVQWPFEWRDCFWHYKRSPIKTLRQVRGMAGAIVAPGTLMDGHVRDGDLALLSHLKRAWTLARGFTRPSGPQWADIRIQVGVHVRKWFQTPGRTRQIQAVVDVLLEHNQLSGKDFAALAAYYAPHDEKRTPYAA
jgi:hypothetical protein